LLIPLGPVCIDPGTLALVNVKVSFGAPAAIAATVDASATPSTHRIDLQFVIGFLLATSLLALISNFSTRKPVYCGNHSRLPVAQPLLRYR
jgi:hypothetical protein